MSRPTLPFEVEITYQPMQSFPWRAYRLPRANYAGAVAMASTFWGLRWELRRMARRFAKIDKAQRRISRAGVAR